MLNAQPTLTQIYFKVAILKTHQDASQPVLAIHLIFSTSVANTSLHIHRSIACNFDWLIDCETILCSLCCIVYWILLKKIMLVISWPRHFISLCFLVISLVLFRFLFCCHSIRVKTGLVNSTDTKCRASHINKFSLTHIDGIPINRLCVFFLRCVSYAQRLTISLANTLETSNAVKNNTCMYMHRIGSQFHKFDSKFKRWKMRNYFLRNGIRGEWQKRRSRYWIPSRNWCERRNAIHASTNGCKVLNHLHLQFLEAKHTQIRTA